MTSSGRFPVPVRSAVISNFTNWCCQNLSKRALNALTVHASINDRIRQAVPNIYSLAVHGLVDWPPGIGAGAPAERAHHGQRVVADATARVFAVQSRLLGDRDDRGVDRTDWERPGRTTETPGLSVTHTHTHTHTRTTLRATCVGKSSYSSPQYPSV